MAGATENAVAVFPDPEAERFVTTTLDSRFRLWTTNGVVHDLGEMPNPWFREVRVQE
ncbi:MAG: hypothetical protein HGB17_11655 [Syntrophobacteraceae bacterium]|nr:hypothetical protein [Syntrophobacteraceae bacterium]